MEGDSSKSSNFAKQYLQSFKEFLIPTTKKDKQKRIKQYKDVLIFLGAILIMTTFESKIEKILSVDPNEIQKMTKLQTGAM